MKRLIVILLVVAALAAGGWFMYDRYLAPIQAQSNEPTYETIVVELSLIHI